MNISTLSDSLHERFEHKVRKEGSSTNYIHLIIFDYVLKYHKPLETVSKCRKPLTDLVSSSMPDSPSANKNNYELTHFVE